MASADMRAATARDWALGNPWFWIAAGLLSTGLAWGLALLDMSAHANLSAIRVVLIFFGLLATGGAVVIRLNSTRSAYLETLSRDRRKLLLGGLVLVYGGLALTATVLLLLRLAGADLPWKPGSLVILWLIIVPMSVSAFSFCSRAYGETKSISEREEASALLVLAAIACVFSCFGLYLGQDRAEEWETIRLLLAVMAFVALVAAPLVVVPQVVRRGVISLLILLHFGGICTAVLAVPPYSPWIISQLWTRIYRPYLEFMYLNNAYHFYSPDPGPATYVWFRLYYEDEQGKLHGEWYKIPEFDDRGFPRYGVALTYQRILALTENITYKTTAPPDREIVQDSSGEIKVMPAKYWERRYKHSPEHRPLIGEAPLPPGAIKIPFHPKVPLAQQYEPPVAEVQTKLESYARHACLRPHPEHPEWRVKRVKVYRVVHLIPFGPYVEAYMNGADPRDPEFYRPYFVGEFDPDGKLINPADPFLYWLMPIYHETPEIIRDYAHRHAGDENWVGKLTPDTKDIEWFSEKQE